MLVAIVIVLAVSAFNGMAPTNTTSTTPPATNQGSTTSNSDDVIAELFANQKTDVQVTGKGVVLRLLPDDADGEHQRFILELDSGQTLLMAHNIEIAPRLDGLAVGDSVEFYGEYYYSEQGGGIHWTHHDPGKEHADGWLLWKGTYFS